MDHGNDNLIGKTRLMTQAKGKKQEKNNVLTTSHGIWSFPRKQSLSTIKITEEGTIIMEMP